MINSSVAESGRAVRTFYEANSFPGYEDFDTPVELAQKAQRGVYAKLLDDHIPPGARVLDAGCASAARRGGARGWEACAVREADGPDGA